MVSIGMDMGFAPLSIIQAMVIFRGEPSKAKLLPQHATKVHCGHFQEDFKPLISCLLMQKYS
jgi:hypothetical protein